MVVPDPLNIRGIRIPIDTPWEQRWLPIKATYPHLLDHEVRAQIEETLSSLRALSKTSRMLRAFAFPRLWSVVQIYSEEQLGRLRETLRVSPHIAQHIKSISFVLWPSWSEPTADDDSDDDDSIHSGDTQLDLVFAGAGPDDMGEDQLIGGAQQFQDCINEIVSQLSSLEAFGWVLSPASLPAESIESMAALGTLTSLACVYKKLDEASTHVRECHGALQLRGFLNFLHADWRLFLLSLSTQRPSGSSRVILSI